ncbi:MAG TPA: respiratory nitrate reductase subunit gamma [Thiobacillaceae bacterium]|nr:respiratory nitrate reductase subunit gamma [Thiobacillaceae bacterium]HNU63458.1 respiratory nitrate reductase subunit gamma [Thiobacillaceae bacterium]
MNFDLHTLLYGVYPYIALVTFALGSWIRFDNEQYTWKSDSSQLLSKANMRLASNLFHVGMLGIFFGHLIGLVTPHGVFQALGISDMAHQGIAIFAGGIFGLMVILGGTMLWFRRLFNKRVRAASRWMDINILGWLVMTAILGFSTIFWSIGHAEKGDATVMLRLAEWVQSIVVLQPNPDLLRGVDVVYKIHIFLGLSVFLFFPFTRLVHIWSAPIGYLFRAYQIVRAKRV